MDYRLYRPRKSLIGLMMAVLLGGFVVQSCLAQAVQDKPQELQGIDIEEHLGQQIPLDLQFTNENGQLESIGSYFKQGKPVIIILAYYECPMLCTLVLNGVAYGINQLDWTLGNEYQILTISINPAETPELAAAKRVNLLNTITKKKNDNGWRFFVGSQEQITKLANAIGFKYYYDENTKQFAHPAVATILAPSGKISRYLYGVEFKKQDLRLALLEASEGKIGNSIDRIILYCFHYDPTARGYVLFANNVMKLGGLATVIAVGALLSIFWIRERRRKPAVNLSLNHN
jgi:protein SCO1